MRSVKGALANGEHGTRGMRDYFVGGGARQMSCGADAARGVADAENDQI